MSTTLNKHSNNYRPGVGPKEVLFFYFNSCKLLVFKRYAMMRLYTTVNVNESSNGESSGHQITHGDEATHESVQSSIILYTSALAQNKMKANTVQIPF